MTLPRTKRLLGGLSALVLLVGVGGCQRAFYRTQADADANCLVDQKAALVAADPANLRIGIDPRSRMYSAENPDCPAMPPDDPIAHAYLECVDGKRGAKTNRCAQRTAFVENPDWRTYLPRDDQGRLVLDLRAAVEVGLLHSTDFQEQLEELYLSALDVSFERFLFDVQFFGGSEIDFEALGRARTGTGNASSLLTVSPSRPGNRFRLEKFTATGGQIVAGFANSFVWQFAGPNNYTSTTLLDFSILQPLLRTGGRARVLETLTIAERALLANVRAMERFRRGFYLSIATGADAGAGPSRRGGFFGGSGLQGFTGVGGGGFGRVGGGGGGGFGGGIGAAGAGGYLGLLQQSQELRNSRANVAALRASVDQLEASFDAGRIDRFQVDLARQALFDGQSLLLTAEADLRTTIDDFLIDLGLPPDLEVSLTDPVLEPFELRSDEITLLQADAAGLALELRAGELGSDPVGEGATTAPPADATEPELLPPLPIDDGAAEAESLRRPVADRGVELATQARGQLEAVEADYKKLLDALPSRKEHLLLIGQREEVAAAQIDPRVLSPERLQARVDRLRGDLDRVAERLESVAAAITSAPPGAEGDKQPRRRIEELSAVVLELSLLQAQARLDTIDIEPTDMTDADALAIASLYRRDWKNARIALVDAWRLINFNANDLLSDLDLVFAGDIGNVGDNPFRLRDTNGSLRVGLQFDTPLTRLGERNVYRQALIEYDQARRNYYQFVDRVSQGLRGTLRQIRLNELNFELRREAVLVAIAQVDLTQIRLSEPPKPGEESQLGGTTARDLVEALADLLNVQNDFLSVWVNNRVQRLQLEFDLGLMQLDSTGQRVDPGMPLKDFLYLVDPAPDCVPGGGGLERLPADILPPAPFVPGVPPPVGLPAVDPGLRFPTDFASDGRVDRAPHATVYRAEPVVQAAFESVPAPKSGPKRLPAVAP